jgi:TolA-binding protein
MKPLALSIILLSITACSHIPKQANTEEKATHKNYEGQIKRLETSLNKQAKLLKQLRDQNEKLRIKLINKKHKNKENRANEAQARPSEFEAQTARAELGEAKLFGTFLSAHNSRRIAKSNRAFYLLEKAYPNSPLLAEALYLRGKRSLESKAYKVALRQMNQIIEQFPSHSRARSAMLAKSVIYRRLKLMKPSVSVLKELMNKYPKTEEAKKAKAHLALLEQKQ